MNFITRYVIILLYGYVVKCYFSFTGCRIYVMFLVTFDPQPSALVICGEVLDFFRPIPKTVSLYYFMQHVLKCFKYYF